MTSTPGASPPSRGQDGFRQIRMGLRGVSSFQVEAWTATDTVVSVEIPMTFKLRGGRKVIVLPDGTQGNPTPKATIDNTMIKAIATGCFAGRICCRTAPTGCLEEIAKAEKLSGPFVSRIIRLALLAPDIMEAIRAGKQPAHLTLKDLMAPFPVKWSGQRGQFGIGGGG